MAKLRKLGSILDPREPFMVGMTLFAGLSLVLAGLSLIREEPLWWVRLLVGLVLLIPTAFYVCAGLKRRYETLGDHEE